MFSCRVSPKGVTKWVELLLIQYAMGDIYIPAQAMMYYDMYPQMRAIGVSSATRTWYPVPGVLPFKKIHNLALKK